MRLVPLAQGSEEWKNWRAEGLGASEAPAICGVSKHTTPLMLFNQKVHGAKPAISDFIKQRGYRFERRAHAMSGVISDLVFEREICAEHETCRFIRASFDGICHEERTFQEIKYVGVDDFARVRAGVMLSHYLPQLAQQAFVSGYRSCLFTAYNDQADHVVSLLVVIDDTLISDVMSKVFAFRKLVLMKTPPPLSDLDVLDVSNIAELKGLFLSLLRAAQERDAGFEKSVRELIAHRMPHQRIECLGVRVTKTRDGKTLFKFPPKSDGASLAAQ